MKPNINPTHIYSPYNYMKFMILLVMVFISLLSTILSHNIFIFKISLSLLEFMNEFYNQNLWTKITTNNPCETLFCSLEQF